MSLPEYKYPCNRRMSTIYAAFAIDWVELFSVRKNQNVVVTANAAPMIWLTAMSDVEVINWPFRKVWEKLKNRLNAWNTRWIGSDYDEFTYLFTMS